MSNEQVRELLDTVMALPRAGDFYMKFEYDTQDGDVSLFAHTKKRCECCGRLEDVNEFKLPNDYDEAKEFIEKWKEIIEKESSDG